MPRKKRRTARRQPTKRVTIWDALEQQRPNPCRISPEQADRAERAEDEARKRMLGHGMQISSQPRHAS